MECGKKVSVLILCAVLNIVQVYGMMCWKCDHAASEDACNAKGSIKKCRLEDLCFTEWRHENGLVMLRKGCKQASACSALEMQNPPQCHPEVNPSVCRHCCRTRDICNRFELLPKPLGIDGAFDDDNTVLPQPRPTLPSKCARNNPRPKPIPSNLTPDDSCVVDIEAKCMQEGSFVIRLKKLNQTERIPGIEFGKRGEKNGRCVRAPTLATVAIYEDEDSFVILTKINSRFVNGLPVGDTFTHKVGGVPVNDFKSSAAQRKKPRVVFFNKFLR